MPSLNALIFDLGNTLIYFDGDWSKVYTQADVELARFLQTAGLNIEQEIFLEQFRKRLEHYHIERESEYIEYTTGYILRTLLNDWGYSEIPDEVIKSALEAMYRVSQDYWLPEEDAGTTLREMKERDYRLGLISNAADDADVQTLVDKADLRPYFEIIISSATVGTRKPHPRIFEIALDALETSASHSAMIGDTLEADILGAHNVGMLGIWITRRADALANRAKADSIKPDGVIRRLSELPDFLDSWEQGK